MSSYPKWVYGPNGEAVVIHTESDRPQGYKESPAEWADKAQEASPDVETPKRRGRKPQE